MQKDVDCVALARIGLTNPDRQPDGSGLDDGPPLPKNSHKMAAVERWRAGGTLRTVAAEFGVSHETVRYWTRGMARASRR